MYLRILRGEEGADTVAKRTTRSSDNSFDTERAVVPAHVTSAHPVADEPLPPPSPGLTASEPGTQSRWRELPNMISSQDGTEERRPRAALRPWRPFCSAAGSPGATASACVAASPGVTGADRR